MGANDKKQLRKNVKLRKLLDMGQWTLLGKKSNWIKVHI